MVPVRLFHSKAVLFIFVFTKYSKGISLKLWKYPIPPETFQCIYLSVYGLTVFHFILGFGPLVSSSFILMLKLWSVWLEVAGARSIQSEFWVLLSHHWFSTENPEMVSHLNLSDLSLLPSLSSPPTILPSLSFFHTAHPATSQMPNMLRPRGVSSAWKIPPQNPDCCSIPLICLYSTITLSETPSLTKHSKIETHTHPTPVPWGWFGFLVINITHILDNYCLSIFLHLKL